MRKFLAFFIVAYTIMFASISFASERLNLDYPDYVGLELKDATISLSQTQQISIKVVNKVPNKSFIKAKMHVYFFNKIHTTGTINKREYFDFLDFVTQLHNEVLTEYQSSQGFLFTWNMSDINGARLVAGTYYLVGVIELEDGTTYSKYTILTIKE
jgi:hypothetical protein